jgi:hypothetical protein
MIAKHARYLIQAGRDAAVLSRTFPLGSNTVYDHVLVAQDL